MDTYHRWMEVTTVATLAGCPAIAVPAGVNEAGLHVGLQVIGRPGEEANLLGWALAGESGEAFSVPSLLRPRSADRANPAASHRRRVATISALIVCSRFSAWSNAMFAGERKTSSVTSRPPVTPVSSATSRPTVCARRGTRAGSA